MARGVRRTLHMGRKSSDYASFFSTCSAASWGNQKSSRRIGIGSRNGTSTSGIYATSARAPSKGMSQRLETRGILGSSSQIKSASVESDAEKLLKIHGFRSHIGSAKFKLQALPQDLYSRCAHGTRSGKYRGGNRLRHDEIPSVLARVTIF